MSFDSLIKQQLNFCMTRYDFLMIFAEKTLCAFEIINTSYKYCHNIFYEFVKIFYILKVLIF